MKNLKQKTKWLLSGIGFGLLGISFVFAGTTINSSNIWTHNAVSGDIITASAWNTLRNTLRTLRTLDSVIPNSSHILLRQKTTATNCLGYPKNYQYTVGKNMPIELQGKVFLGDVIYRSTNGDCGISFNTNGIPAGTSNFANSITSGRVHIKWYK